MLERSVVQEIQGILEERDIETKLRLTTRLCADSAKLGTAVFRYPGKADQPLGAVRPGRPESWQVVDPSTIPDRPKLGDPRGRYRLIHSVANIELAAIELMLMAVADFPGEPQEYYQAMLQVAREEVMHTRMLMRRLKQLGGEFGSEPVHLGLWETAIRWDDLPGRLGVVPRILEARGLDVSDRLRDQLGKAGDHESAEVLERIYYEEIGHVGVGTTWYRAACELRGLDPEAHFVDLVHRFQPRRAGPRRIDREGRIAAGFTERELLALEGRDEEPEGERADS
ncbi:MAG: ferritin-like domain-containing protein [Candidatus Eisenbacteria bacterium]|nr:ferritin-like domain-containing protein [Candidatus Eisenbacteria bacterium]